VKAQHIFGSDPPSFINGAKGGGIAAVCLAETGEIVVLQQHFSRFIHVIYGYIVFYCPRGFVHEGRFVAHDLVAICAVQGIEACIKIEGACGKQGGDADGVG
jgi:hypothetical protein